MTKTKADEIKKIIKTVGGYTVYYNSKKEELRVMVAEYSIEMTTDERGIKAANANTIKILSALSKNGLRPEYKKDVKTYQGFLRTRYIVFY